MSSYTVEYTTELMTNYAQAEIMSPEADIVALQTSQGGALLFSIGTDNALYATVETVGTRNGWSRANLSAARAAKDFAGVAGVTCSRFAAAQCANGTIHLAMVLRANGNDHLYLSLGNTDTDTSWIVNPTWTPVPYDDASHPRSPLVIAGTFISEATDAEYIVVDVVRDPASVTSLIFRYYIDPAKANGTAWQPHDVAADIQVGKYQSRLGRKANQGAYSVDGIVTSGQINGKAQLLYAPLYNVFDPSIPPNPDILQLPGGAIAEAVATCRNADNTADVYATSGGALYWFAGNNQENGATGVRVANNALFTGVSSLFAFLASPTQVVVWGLNSSDQIFYTTCPVGNQASPAAWSVPVPILSGVEQLAPFANRAYSANCFFAHTGQSKLVKAVKSPNTLLWTYQSITLPPPTPTLPAQSFSSYTTRIQVTGGNGQPAASTAVQLSATNVVPVTINHLYYLLSPTPINVTTDALGCITVVEAVDSIQGSRLTVAIGAASTQINPMDKPFRRSASLNSPGALQGATIRYQDGSSKKLVPPGTSGDALNTVATSNTQLATAYQSVTGAAPAPHLAAALAMPAALGSGNILVDAGDFFSWLGSRITQGFNDVVRFIEDTARHVWTIVVEIAGETYGAILSTVETVVEAAIWIYDKIKVAVEDVIDFLKFLFDLDDLKRTKAVIKNTVKLYLRNEVDQIEVLRHGFDGMIAAAEKAVNNWAGVGSWSGLGSDATAPVNSKSTPTAHQSAPGALLGHHFQGNARNYSFRSSPPQPPDPTNIFAALIQAIEAEGEAIGTAITRIQDLASDFTSMPLGDALKQLLAIVVDFGLDTVRNVVDAVLDVIHILADTALKLLDTPIHIPVLSDILNSLGVPDFSFLDILCWVAAVPTNLLYKAVNGTTPFPDNEQTAFMIGTTSWTSLSAAFAAPVQPAPRVARAALAARPLTAPAAGPDGGGGLIPMPESAQRAVFVCLQCVSGFAGLMSAIVGGFEAAEEKGDNPWSIPSAVLGVLGGAGTGIATTLVSYDSIESAAVGAIGKGTTTLRILNKLVFSNPGQGAVKKFNITSLAVEDARGVAAIVDAVLALPGAFVSIWHFVELGQKPAGGTRSISIVNEVSSTTSYVSRVSYTVAVNVEDERVKAVAIAAMVIASVATGGLLIADAIIN